MLGFRVAVWHHRGAMARFVENTALLFGPLL
jgi:hypothetical protein